MTLFPFHRSPGAPRGRRLHVLLILALLPLAPADAVGQVAPHDPPVRPGDIIELRVWRDTTLSGKFQVDQHGLVTLPLVGQLSVQGQTELSLRRKVRAELRKQIWNPSIALFVLKRVRVLGAVTHPGVYELNGTMSVADALAMAGGRTQLAEEGKVTLHRDGKTIVSDVRDSMLLADLAVQTGDELLVRERSWLDRNATALMTGAAALIGVMVAIFR